MHTLIKTILISSITSVVVLFGFVQYYPFFKSENLGIAALTDITSGDTVANFPAVYTANNTALENAINTIEGTTTNSTITTLSGLTTASSLVTVGTVTTGTWNADTITEAYGGTNQTTYTTGDILYASGANTLAKLGIGSPDQVLTVSGGIPAWVSGSVDETLSYNFTGTNFLVKNLNASSTVANPLILNGVSYAFPSVDGASSTSLKTDGAGNLSWNTENWVLLASTTLASPTATTTLSVENLNAYKIYWYADSDGTGIAPVLKINSDSTANYGWRYSQNGGADVTKASDSHIQVGVSTGNEQIVVIEVFNSPSGEKGVVFQTSSAFTGASVPTRVSGVGVYNSTNAVNDFTFTDKEGDTLNTGTRIIIYGAKQ